jgi:hypothetical protein
MKCWKRCEIIRFSTFFLLIYIYIYIVRSAHGFQLQQERSSVMRYMQCALILHYVQQAAIVFYRKRQVSIFAYQLHTSRVIFETVPLPPPLTPQSHSHLKRYVGGETNWHGRGLLVRCCNILSICNLTHADFKMTHMARVSSMHEPNEFPVVVMPQQLGKQQEHASIGTRNHPQREPRKKQ